MYALRVFRRYAGRGVVVGLLTLFLLQLTGANAAALAQCGHWRIVPSPNVGNNPNTLFGVSAVSPDDVWAVGTAMTVALTQHWNGTQWSVVPNPTGSTYYLYPTLYSVAAIATNNVWAVGYAHDINGDVQTLIEQWNGQKWQLVPSADTTAQLTGVSALSANDIWAVGTSGIYPNPPIIEHWNGTQWSVVPNPSPHTSMNAVAAVAANDVWAVGNTPLPKNHEALVEHWNGAKWSMVFNPRPPSSCVPQFSGITAISANDVWAVGSDWGNCYDSPPYALIEHWDGSHWKVVHTPNGNATNQLNGVAAASSTNMWAVGQFYDKGQALTFHWNGSRWSNVANPGSTYSWLNGVAATSAGDFWAVGTYMNYYRTLIEFYC